MKKAIFTFLLFCILLVTGSSLLGQKPQVQVTFRIDSANAIFESFESSIVTMEEEAMSILIDGLNEYIGFVEFGSDSAAITLQITLKNKIPGNSGFNQEFWMFFELVDAELDSYLHEWQFLDVVEYYTHNISAASIIEKLEEDWDTYLKKSYNFELVTNLFDEIAIPLPDSAHYYIDEVSGIQEAILPFKKEMLNINPDESEFNVIINGETLDGSPTERRQKENTYSGLVDGNIKEEHSPLMGCIRIALKPLPNMRLMGGKVFITFYKRKTYSTSELAGTSDFFEAIPNN